MAFYEVEPFLQIDNNYVSGIYKENTFIIFFMAGIMFDCSPGRVVQVRVKMVKVEAQCLVASGKSFLPIPVFASFNGGSTVLGGVR